VTKLEEARALADEFLFPTANDVDKLAILPRERLDRLAADGWYGLASPSSGVQMAEGWPILSAIAGGCMTTTLVWQQHHGLMASVSFGPEHLKHLVAPLAAGDLRASVSYGGLLPVPTLRAREDGDSFVIDGVAPWMSGWGLCDLVYTAARAENDDVVWVIVDADAPGLSARPHRLLGLNASSTVTLHYESVRAEAAMLVNRFPWAEWPARDAAGIRGNGSVSIGLAERCARMIGSDALAAEIREIDGRLEAGDATTFPRDRAAASAIAVRAATALLVHQGSSAVEIGTDAERLYREAAVLQVFASRPSIRLQLLSVLGAATPAS
jgi:alkylation response protein AidB-like acyl-CoA dehydrogenase